MKTSYLIRWKIDTIGSELLAIDIENEFYEQLPANEKYEIIKKKVIKELDKEYNLENYIYGFHLNILSVDKL